MIPQLRIRTEYSFRQTFAPVDLIAETLKESHCPAAAIVDGGTWGAVKWNKALSSHGIRSFYGRTVAIPRSNEKKPLAWVLARDTKAFFRFSSAVEHDPDNAEELMRTMPGIIRFAGDALSDPETFDYIDLNPASALSRERALQLHKETGKPLVVTSNNAYPRPKDYDAFAAIGKNECVTPQHILTEQEMRTAMPELSDEQFAAAVANVYEIADQCATELPKAPLVEVEGDIRTLAEEGRKKRLQLGQIAEWTGEYEERLQEEIALVEEKSFSSYFLVVADLVKWAKDRMLVGPGRGSSSGSLLCFLLEITEADSIKHGLLFARFIDRNRTDLPDIDIDFNDLKRYMIFDYLTEKYGDEYVARVGSINQLKPRSALAEVCKRMAVPDKDRFDLLNVMSEYSSGDARYGNAMRDTLLDTDVGRGFAQRNPEALVVREVENHAWHHGKHAAGVLVGVERIDNFCTVQKDMTAQIDKHDADDFNLLKIDALGLRTLGILEDTGLLTNDELYSLPLDDAKIFETLNNGKFAGIFQFEGPTQKSVASAINIDSFKTIDHITALARPGPLGGGAAQQYIDRKAGNAPVEYDHPLLEPILKDTLGVALFQENVMAICRGMGKFSWEQTSVIRKAISKSKGEEQFYNLEEQFVTGAAEDGVSEENARYIWKRLCTFGAWGFVHCLSAHTRVRLYEPDPVLGETPTVAALYRAINRKHNFVPALWSVPLDGLADESVPNHIVDIIYNGEQKCDRLTAESGKEVKATPNHRFMVEGKWTMLSDVEVGDMIHLDEGKREEVVKIDRYAGHNKPDVYDIVMAEPHHNFLLANDIISHNSHTCAYSMISYWTAWAKTYHPVEYAAACLRRAKDDEQALEILREVTEEGVPYIPFDKNRSEINWSVSDGTLLGGFQNLKGFGPVKARKMINKRARGEELPPSVEKAEIKFSQLYPITTKYRRIIDDPESAGCRRGSKVSFLNDLPEDGEALIIGRVVKKRIGDLNEAVRIKKRNGKVLKGPTGFIDLFIVDDTGGPLTVRIDREDFATMGQNASKYITEKKDDIMIRAKIIPGFNMVRANKVRVLTQPGVKI